MPKVAVLILNVLRGILLLAAAGAVANAAISRSDDIRDVMFNVVVAVTAAVAAVALAPPLWTTKSAPAQSSAGSVTVAPGQAHAASVPPTSSQPAHPGPQQPFAPQPSQSQPGQVYGGTYQGQAYGQAQAGPGQTGPVDPGARQPGPPEWQQRPGGGAQ